MLSNPEGILIKTEKQSTVAKSNIEMPLKVIHSNTVELKIALYQLLIGNRLHNSKT